MNRTEVDRFLSDLQKDPGLRQEMAALGQDMEACVRRANAKGYQFTLEDATGTLFDPNLSDDDLEQVAGGWCGNETTIG